MKSKTLALITAALITAAALILTLSLSLLSGAAIDSPEVDIDEAIVSAAEPVTDNGIADDDVEIEVNVEDTNDVQINNDVDEEIYVVPENKEATDEPVVDEPTVDEPVIDEPVTDEPEIEDVPVIEEPSTDLGNPVFAPSIEWKGGELTEGHCAPYFIYDVVVQVYEHATGKLVSQTVYMDDQIWEDINQLHLDVYQQGNLVYDPGDKDAVPVGIPNGKYRVEVYAIWYADNGGCGNLFFAYTYGTNELMEVWKHGQLHSGAQDFIAYVDALIADEMALVEAGQGNIPAPTDDVTYICGFGADKVSFTAFNWNGDFHKIFESGRGVARFPYLETEN